MDKKEIKNIIISKELKHGSKPGDKWAEAAAAKIVERLTDEPDKVSDCCGAEVSELKNEGTEFEYRTCKSCGYPCDVVEEHYCDGPDCPCQVPDDFDPDKPDPIEPLGVDKIASGKGWSEYHQKINEQSEVINWLLEQHD